MDVSIRDKGVFAFGRFRLDAVRRSLTRDGEKLNLPPRLFDTLLYLVENQGRVVEKDELFNAVWGARIVEEANLTQTIFSLRKALGSEADGTRFIATVPGRGYRFATPVCLESGAATISSASNTMLAQLSPISQPMGDLPNAAAKSGSNRIGRAALPMAALCVLATVCAAGAAWLALPAGRQSESAAAPPFDPPPHSVAILPFTNVGGDPAQEYFSDGMSDELIDALSQIEALHVVGRTSSFFFKGKSVTVAAIARALNVGAVLEGSVRREDRRLRMTVDLVDAKSGFTIWSHSYDRDRSAVLNMQNEIAAAVVRSLQVTFLADDAKQLEMGGTQNPLALDAYLRGRRSELENDLSDTKAALTAFDEAIKLDPNYTVAHMRRSIDLRYLAIFQSSADISSLREIRRQASAEADLAIQSAPNLGMAHIAKAAALEDNDMNYIAAASEDYRALALSPNDANTLRSASADLFQLTNRKADEWLAMANRAIELDPFSPFGYADITYIYFALHRYDDALAALHHEEQLEQTSTTSDAYSYGVLQIMKGNPQAAHLACAGQRDYIENLCLALAYHALGMQSDAALQLGKALAARGDNSAFYYAAVLAQWGQTAESLFWLKIAYEARNPEIESMRVEPLLDPIRKSPEFQEIEKKVNFPD